MPYLGTVDLQVIFGINQDRDDTLANLGYTLASAKTKFPLFYGYWKYKGYADADFTSMYEYECAWNEAFWKTWGYASETVPNYADPRSRGSIDAPDGAYRVKFGCMVGYGQYRGKGSNCYWVTKGQPNAGSTAGTAIVIDHAGWLKQYAPERFCLRSCSWGKNDGNAYMQGTVIEGFWLEGGYADKAYDASFVSSGVGINDFGEASAIKHCYANGFNTYGFQLNKGTPSMVFACSAFSNRKAGFGIVSNNGLNTTTLIGCSGDDNPTLYEITNETGGAPGGTITIIGTKSETGKRTPLQYQRVLKASGALNVVMDGVSADSQNGTTPCAFEVDFGTYMGQVVVNGVRLNGYTNAIQVKTTKGTTTYPSPGNYKPFSFVLNEDVGLQSATRTMGSVTPPTNPDPPTDPPTNPPTNPSVVWKTAMGGTDKTKLKAVLGADLTAKYTWSALTSLAAGIGTTHANTIFGSTFTNVTKVTYLNTTFTSLQDWKWLNDKMYMLKSGEIYSRINGVDTLISKVQLNVTYARLELPMTAANLGSIIGYDGNATVLMKIGGIEITA